ncbi:hypothetical protein IHE31_14770 [Mycetohabitans rhizoxinica]
MSIDSVAHAGIAPELGIPEPASVQSVAPLYLAGATREARYSMKRMTGKR